MMLNTFLLYLLSPDDTSHTNAQEAEDILPGSPSATAGLQELLDSGQHLGRNSIIAR
jgi:hypothetical protein